MGSNTLWEPASASVNHFQEEMYRALPVRGCIIQGWEEPNETSTHGAWILPLDWLAAGGCASHSRPSQRRRVGGARISANVRWPSDRVADRRDRTDRAVLRGPACQFHSGEFPCQ